MPTLKSYLQSIVTAKVPQAFAPKSLEAPKITATGILPLDAFIRGFQRGGITEIYGSASSGRTTIATSFMAEITRQQQCCAIVDTLDSLDPESLAAAGVDLSRVLWIRCGSSHAGSSSSIVQADLKSDQSKCHSTALTTARPLVLASRHPRNEVRGMSHAVAHFMGNESANSSQVSLTESREAALSRKNQRSHEEQVSTDRLPPRRGDSILSKPVGLPNQGIDFSTKHQVSSFNQESESGNRREAKITREIHHAAFSNRPTHWSRLEKALKVTDLLLHNGGFGAVVMDLGDVPPLNARRIPLTSWFRFRRSIENTPTVLLLLTCEPCAQTCASLVLRCEHHKERWNYASTFMDHSKIATLEGLNLNVEVMRHRFSGNPEKVDGNPLSSTNFISWQTWMGWTE